MAAFYALFGLIQRHTIAKNNGLNQYYPAGFAARPPHKKLDFSVRVRDNLSKQILMVKAIKG